MATASRTSIMLWHDSNIAEITCWYADVIGEVTQWHGNNINGSNIREVTKWYRGHWVRSWCQRQQLFIEQRAGLTSWELSVSRPHSGVCTLPSCRMSYTRASLVVSGFVMNFLSAQNKLPAVISISFLNEIIFLTPGDPASLPHLVTASSRPSSKESFLRIMHARWLINGTFPFVNMCEVGQGKGDKAKVAAKEWWKGYFALANFPNSRCKSCDSTRPISISGSKQTAIWKLVTETTVSWWFWQEVKGDYYCCLRFIIPVKDNSSDMVIG